MRRLFLLLLPLALLGLLLSGCAVSPAPGSSGGAEEDGGRRDLTDPDAPKVIQSSQIVRFDCRFTTLTEPEVPEEGASPLAGIPTMGRQACHLSASLENGAVVGLYEAETPTRSVSRPFRADHSFMNELQGLVGELYDLAQYNGICVEVQGLPDRYGASLDVVYASGETIRASNNEEGFLTGSAMSALDWLFASASASPPASLPLTLRSPEERERTEDGGFVTLRRPEPSLGYSLPDGTMVPPDGYDALAAAVDGIAARDRELASAARARFGRAPAGTELYWRTEAILTRSDGELLSFFEVTRRYEDAGWEHEMTEVRGHNLDPATGRALGFADVFRDLQLLPSAIFAALARQYPEQTFYEEAPDFITRSVLQDDGNVTFALSSGCAHIFINEYVLNDEPGGQRVTLSFTDYPTLLRPWYMTAPRRGLLPLEYGVDYDLPGIGALRLDCRTARTGARWTARTERGEITEAFSGSAPACALAWQDGFAWLYLRIPADGAAALTNVYPLQEDRFALSTQMGLALRDDSPWSPEHMLMNVNETVSARAGSIRPYGLYRLGRDGLPEFIGGTYRLEGGPMALREDARVNPPEREQAAVSGGMWNLFRGELLYPEQTDLSGWIQFRTEDDRLCRFEIDGFRSGMHLDNFGTLDELFLPAGAGS